MGLKSENLSQASQPASQPTRTCLRMFPSQVSAITAYREKHKHPRLTEAALSQVSPGQIAACVCSALRVVCCWGAALVGLSHVLQPHPRYASCSAAFLPTDTCCLRCPPTPGWRGQPCRLQVWRLALRQLCVQPGGCRLLPRLEVVGICNACVDFACGRAEFFSRAPVRPCNLPAVISTSKWQWM